MLIRWCKTDICSFKTSAKVFLMLYNPFLVPSLCKLNRISLWFIQISTKSAYFLQGKQSFFWSHLRCYRSRGKFQHNIKISIKTACVSSLSVSYDYDDTYHWWIFLKNPWYNGDLIQTFCMIWHVESIKLEK